ncbi:MAG TPA: hypothetical protein VIM73_18620 [Polyangiaceae bacterium]
MATNFEPNERQRRLIAEAKALAADAHEPGHPAPAELVRRMTMEGSAAMLSPDSQDAGNGERDSPTFRITLAAAVQGPVTRDAVLAMLGADTCRGAAVFKAPRHIVLLDFELPAETHEMAMTTCVSEVLCGFPQAELIDLNDPNSLVDELVEASAGREPTPREMVRMRRSDAPTIDAFARAAAMLDGFLVAAAGRALGEEQLSARLGAAPGGRRRGELLVAPGSGATLIEADVFEVSPEFGLARFMSDGGSMLTVTPKTPGITSLAYIKEGQRYECLVTGRFNLVVFAGLIG